MSISLDMLKEKNFHETVAAVKWRGFAHCTTVMVTEKRMEQLKRMFTSAAVPYSGNGNCFMFC